MREMHECEYHICEVFSPAWDKAYDKVEQYGLDELTPEFLDEVYSHMNAQCSDFDNYDIQFDTIDTCFKNTKNNPYLAGFAYCVYVSYQIDEETFEFSLYFGEAKSDDFRAKGVIYKSRFVDAVCIMSAGEDQKEQQFLERFSQIKSLF